MPHDFRKVECSDSISEKESCFHEEIDLLNIRRSTLGKGGKVSRKSHALPATRNRQTVVESRGTPPQANIFWRKKNYCSRAPRVKFEEPKLCCNISELKHSTDINSHDKIFLNDNIEKSSFSDHSLQDHYLPSRGLSPQIHRSQIMDKDLPEFPGFEPRSKKFSSKKVLKDESGFRESPMISYNPSWVKLPREDVRDSLYSHSSQHLQHPSVFNYLERNHDGNEADSEMDLFSMGFNRIDVKWENIRAPERRELHRIIHFRICHYINPDIIVGIDDHEFFCHRLVLQSYSEFFDEFNNLDSYCHIDISDKNVSKAAFIAIYSWMLSLGQGGFHHLKRDNILEVLIACQSLKVKDFENQCLAFIDDKSVFTEDNAYFLFMQASKMKQTSVMELMIPRVQAFFLSLVSSKNFVELSIDDLCTFLQSNYIVVHCELEVFMSGVRWLMYKWKERSKMMIRVMKCIRFGLLTPSQLVEIRKNPESPEFLEITQDKEVQKLIEDGLAYSVEKTLSGGLQEHKQRCELLGLKVPSPRNWTAETKAYRSYREFLEFLKEIRSNPKLMYEMSTINSTAFISSPQVSCSSSNLCLSDHEFTSFHAQNKEDIPSMTDLLFHDRTKNVDKKIEREPKVGFDNVISELNNRFGKNEITVLPAVNMPEKLNRQHNTKEELGKRIAEGLNKLCKTPYSKDIVNKAPKRISLKENAAIVIQAYTKGYLARKKYRPMLRGKVKKEIKKKEHILPSSMTLPMTSFTSPNAIPTQPPPSPPPPPLPAEAGVASTEKHKNPCRESTPAEAGIVSIEKHENACRESTLAEAGIVSIEKHKNACRESSPAEAGIVSIEKHKNACRESTPAEAGIVSIEKHKNACRESTLGKQMYSNSILQQPTKAISEKSKRNYMITSSNSNGTSDFHKKDFMLPGSLFFSFHEAILVFGGLDPSTYLNPTNNGSSIFRYGPIENKWESVGSIPEPRYYHSVTFFKGKVYLAGGSDPRKEEINQESVSDLVWSFDPVTKTWHAERKMIIARKNFGFVAFNGFLYAIGGQDRDDKVLSSVERYDPLTKNWTEMSPLTVARVGAAVTQYNEVIWVAGGMGNSLKQTILKHVECYDPKRNVWTSKTPLRFPRAFAVLFSMQDVLYLVGGASKDHHCAASTQAVDVWDEKNKEWKLKAEMSIPRHGHSICHLGSQMVIIGGTTTAYMRSLNSVEAWCVNRGTWVRGVAPLPAILAGHSAVSIPKASEM